MTDRFVVRTVVVGLLVVVFATLIAALVLTLNNMDVPDYLKYVGTTALGVLVGVPVKSMSDEPQPVQVVDQPVATKEVSTKGRRRT